MDVITCGGCNGEFPLCDITYFIRHKAGECRRSLYSDLYGRTRAIVCSSCSCQFKTAWSLLRHHQDSHNLKLYVETFSREEGVEIQEDNHHYTSPVREQLHVLQGHSPASHRDTRERRYQDSSCLMIDSPDSCQCRANIGEWEENCNKSPVISPRSKHLVGLTMLDQGDIPFPDSPMGRSFHGNPVECREEPDPLPLDLKITNRESGSCCSDLNSDSDNSSTCSAHRSYPPLEDSHSSGYQSSILPKKRKWPHADQCNSLNKTVSAMCRSSSLVESIVAEPTRETELNNISNPNSIVPFIPKWKYSMDLQNSVPLLALTDNRWSVIAEDVVDSPDGERCSSSSNHLGFECDDPRDIPVSPGSVIVDHSDSPVLILDDEIAQRSRIRSCSSEENHPPDPVQTLPTASRDHTLLLLHSTELNVKNKKRRYPTTRPFQCDHCDHSFNQRIHLKKHLSKHTGIKPFKCGLCDYSTVERSHLKVHVRIHTGEKPYKCTYCDYATAQNSTLKIHLKRHHGGQMFKCKTCSKCFTQLTMLNSHTKNHMHNSNCYQDRFSAQNTLLKSPSNVPTVA